MLRFFILMSGMSPSIPTADGRRESVGSAVLVINSGSSSLKFSLIDGNREEVLVQGLAEALGSADAVLHVARPDQAKETRAIPGAHHSQAMAAVLEVIEEFHIAAVGHLSLIHI